MGTTTFSYASTRGKIMVRLFSMLPHHSSAGTSRRQGPPDRLMRPVVVSSSGTRSASFGKSL